LQINEDFFYLELYLIAFMKPILKNCLRLLLLFWVIVLSANLSLAHPSDTAASKPATPVKAKRVLYGLASFYANSFNGKETAFGEIFNQNKMTCACNVLPLGTWIRVTNMRNGRTVLVKTNDRLHPRMKRIVDLSRSAAVKLGYVSHGLTRVKVEVLGKKDPRKS
jgi:rare lipoprotein A